MSLLDYKSFLNESLNEGLSAGYTYLAGHIGPSGMKAGSEVDYKIIFDKATASGGPEAAILNEIQAFEDFLKKIGDSARGDVATESEDLVAIILGGSNSNVLGEADTIFSDVTMPNGEKVSVKTSNSPGFTKVLSNSPIKVQQLMSVILEGGDKAITKQDENYFMGKLETNPDELIKRVQNDNSLFSIAAAYKFGVDYVVEKSVALTKKQILEGLLKNVDQVKKYLSSNKGRISTVAGFLMGDLGFSVSAKYTIKGVSESDIGKLAKERKIILKNIEKKVSTPDLRNIAKANHLPTDTEI
jgi:hypothetical protein